MEDDIAGKERPGKRIKKDNEQIYGKLLYKIQLSDIWIMIITAKGERFYYNVKEGNSVWQMPVLSKNDAAVLKLNEIKDLVVCLLGMIRGVKLQRKLVEQIQLLLGIESRGEEKNLLQRKEPSKTDTIDVVDDEEEAGRDDHEDDERDEDDEDADADDDDTGDEFALGLSDLEEFENLSGNEDNHDLPILETQNPEIGAYLHKYANLPKILQNHSSATDLHFDASINAAVGFVKLLEESNMDPFSSYDLEIDDIILLSEYVTRSCHLLGQKNLRDIWDEYCRVQELDSTSNDSTSIMDVSIPMVDFDTPELQFVLFLKNTKFEKIPKFYTDFNRQCMKKSKEADQTEFKIYPDFCKSLPLKSRQAIYSKWVQMSKMNSDQTKDAVVANLKKIKKDGSTLFELMNTLKQKKLFEQFDCFFVDPKTLHEINDELNN